VVGGDDGGGVVHGAVGVTHLEPSAAKGAHDVADQRVAGDGEPGADQAPGAELGRGQGHQGVDGRPSPVGGDRPEAERPRQVGHDGARHRLDRPRHLADAVVGRGDDQEVDTLRRPRQVVAASEQGCHVPAGRGEGPSQRRAGPTGTDDPHPRHD
jgi:hypothetical protein